jgi:hypothetical protein
MFETMKRVGLALGSGGARGWAHIDVIRALQEAGIGMVFPVRGHQDHPGGPSGHEAAAARPPAAARAGRRVLQPSWAQQAVKAAAGSAAALIGRPITSWLAPAAMAAAGVITRF